MIQKADELTAIAGIDDEAYMTPLGVRKAIMSLLGPLFSTEAVIARWNADKGSRTLYGGLNQSAGGSALGGGGGAGRVFVLDSKKHRIRQDGFIRSVKLSLFSTYTGDKSNSLKALVFRDNGAGYTLVSQSELLSPANTTATQTFTLATPIACQKGDVEAIWVKGFSDLNIRGGALTGAKVRYQDGEALPGTWADIANFGMDVSFEGQSPFIISTGDSIMAGYNTGSPWHTHYDALGISGTPTSDPMTSVQNAIPGLSYQNFCHAGTTWADAVGKVAAINSAGSRAVIAAYGVNDISAGRLLSAIEADMNAFRAGLSPDKKLFIREVLPWTAGNDTHAAATRSLNANYASWCAANDAILIRTHDAMGQVRASTGELDDLKTSYSLDGVHLTSAGVAALSGLIEEKLRSILWLTQR